MNKKPTSPTKAAEKGLLIVDDDDNLRQQLRWAFDDYDVIQAGGREEVEEILAKAVPPVVLLDLGLPPDRDGPTVGFDLLNRILNAEPTAKVIIMTGQTDRQYALGAVAMGAYDFYEKPIEIEVLKLGVGRAFRLHEIERENRRLAQKTTGHNIPGFVTNNPVMLTKCQEVEKFAEAEIGLLLLGESGTGKEVLARGAHELSSRHAGPFIAINCAAIPQDLVESEFFGHEKGAFTGAVKMTVGKVELAQEGTLFLDEIGDLPLSLQAKLLRFLQDHVIERVGGRSPIEVDVRVISATNQDLEKLIGKGEFREDLFYRLSESVVSIPPLRERPDDIILIAQMLLHRFAEEQRKKIGVFSPHALAAMSSYEWPGNVRELENRIKRAVVLAKGPKIEPADLGLSPSVPAIVLQTLKDAREHAERSAVQNAMAATEDNVSEAARLLDVSRPTMYDLLKKYNMRS
jgi:two-component system NtrC family response regulator